VTGPAVDPSDIWGTESAKESGIGQVAAKFRASLLERAQKRSVQQVTPNRWIVFGDPNLGDAYPRYSVMLEGTRYICSCYSHHYGTTRARKICSHVLATIIYRKLHKDSIPSPQDPMFGLPPLPDKFQVFRPHQWEAIQAVVKAFDAPGCKVILLDAPTGSGKTLIAEAARRLLNTRALYVCTTKTLQDQFLRDFEYAALLKGRNNYPTLDYPERFGPTIYDLTCADCDRRRVNEEYSRCSWCKDTQKCPYEVAKRRALAADLAVINTAYYLAEANGPGAFSDLKKKPSLATDEKKRLIILDEADKLESELMRHVEITISARTRNKLGIGVPARKTVPEAWANWVKGEALPAVHKALEEARAVLGETPENPPVSAVRWKKHLERLEEELTNCDLAGGNWVYTGYSQTEDAPVMFRPVKVSEHGPKLLWRHAHRFLLMSATIIDAEGLAEDLGIASGTWRVVRVPNTFPAERRPIFVIPRANMTAKNRAVAWPQMAAAVGKIAQAYPTDRILVHAVSYQLTDYLYTALQQQVGTRVVRYTNAVERNAVLERFTRIPGAIIIAPSLDRGVDLPDDLCRVVIIAKIPFPDLGDKQIAARLYSKGGERWYTVQTIRTMVQMSGRGMRSVEDQCDIYVLDQQFMEKIWRKARTLLPDWWQEAIVRSGSPKVKL